MHACLAPLPLWGPSHGCLANFSSKLSARSLEMRGIRYRYVGRAIAMSWAWVHTHSRPFKGLCGTTIFSAQLISFSRKSFLTSLSAVPA